MIIFDFRVNKTFLEYPNHPITIPKTHYSELISFIYRGKGNRTVPVRINPPTGRILDGKIYCGTAGYGTYYQIKVMGTYPGVYFGDLKIGDVVCVSIARSDERINVKILSPKQKQQIAKFAESSR